MIPRATYRLQFRNGMDFAKAMDIVPYLEKLGISHLYASPLYAAVAGSTHGYDVIDHNVVEPALGGMDGLRALSNRLKQAGMGMIIDIVPNHMAASLQNPWWSDIVEWGAVSRYAEHFDIDWRRKLTLPILASTFEDALAADELAVKFDEQNACLALSYFDNLQPLHPHTYDQVLAAIDDPLAREMAACAANAEPFDGAWKEQLRPMAGRGLAGNFHRELARLSRERSRVDEIHHHQPWRLIDWRDAGSMLSYRRFFEIAGLVGLRVEERRVFDAVHELTLALVSDGIVQGLRVDHVDGLTDPRTYLTWLRAAVGPDPYLVVEKILAEDEELPADWPVQGTTGYEFISTLAQAFVDPPGRARLEEAYLAERPAGTDLEAERHKAKRLIAENNFAGELNRLVDLARMAENRFHAKDLKPVISALIAVFPVYRTYGDSDGMNARDRVLLGKIADAVKERDRGVDESVLDSFVVLLAEGKGETAVELRRRFQQLSSAVMAKSVEDTLFYRWHAFVAVNEVGSDPAVQTDPDGWHSAMARRKLHQAQGLLATATHDTKHGEDSRVRLYALSERPQDWLNSLSRWCSLAGSTRDQPSLDSELQWLVFQSLASIWPSDEDSPVDLLPRFTPFVEKALREAKLQTSWTHVDAGYERSWIAFAERLLAKGNKAFADDFTAALRPYIHAGWMNSLGQTLLKLTAPGIPDIYQGSEVGDFSLVDPDNRRPVDFDFLARSLREALPAVDQGSLGSGRMKQKLIAICLSYRMTHSALFAFGSYEPLGVSGRRATQVIAYLRRRGSTAMVVIVPRLTFGLCWPFSAEDFWRETHVLLPRDFRAPVYSLFCDTGMSTKGTIRLSEHLGRWPVGLFVRHP